MSKRVQLDVGRHVPYQFRLLSDGLLGFAWPKWVRSGGRSKFRVHSVEPYRLSLWRYGLSKEFIWLLGWFDEHGPRAVMQITPDGDYTQNGVRWNTVGYGSPHHTQLVTAPDRSGLYYFHAKGKSGRFSCSTVSFLGERCRHPEAFAHSWDVLGAGRAGHTAVRVIMTFSIARQVLKTLSTSGPS